VFQLDTTASADTEGIPVIQPSRLNAREFRWLLSVRVNRNEPKRSGGTFSNLC
jgi:hypothetical protein